MNFIWFLLIGLAAGWIAGQIMKGKGFGLWGNMALGVVGAYFGGWLLKALGLIAYGTMGTLIAAVIGAVVLLFLVGLIKKM